jgi:hypothetical protein
MVLRPVTAGRSRKLQKAKVLGLDHPLDGVTNPKYKLLHLLKTEKREEGTSF